jgi:hypothetical protein
VIILLDLGPKLESVRAEMAPDLDVLQLLTPLTGYAWQGGRFAMDNGAYSSFSPDRYRAMLERMYKVREQCIFVTAPDVVGCARRTLETFRVWERDLRSWPIAFVAQDGMEDFDIPWDQIAAVFIGGSTEWKLSIHAAHIVKAARILGKWVHVGRVNTVMRYEHFMKLGADSFDGSGLARFTWMRSAIKGLAAQATLTEGPGDAKFALCPTCQADSAPAPAREEG